MPLSSALLANPGPGTGGFSGFLALEGIEAQLGFRVFGFRDF